MNYHELTRGEFWLDSVEFLLSDPPYNDLDGYEDGNYGHDVLIPFDKEDSAALCMAVMKPGPHGHLFCFIQQFCQ